MPENLVYGKQFNAKWMYRLYKKHPSTFTFAQAKVNYHKLHPGDTAMPGMNCGNYLAGAVAKGWVERVSRGVYVWTELGKFQAGVLGNNLPLKEHSK